MTNDFCPILNQKIGNHGAQIIRCAWAIGDPLNIAYHDQEWGVPIFDDRLLFEFLILEGAQAGLSWLTILKRREHYRQAFDNFEATKIIQYNELKINELVHNPQIIRNRLKIAATISNAQAFLQVQKEWQNFSHYIWHFTGGKPLQNHWNTPTEIPASTPLSEQMSKDLKKRGFKFVGPTICYAFMQAVGIINDHSTDCFRYTLRLHTNTNSAR